MVSFVRLSNAVGNEGRFSRETQLMTLAATAVCMATLLGHTLRAQTADAILAEPEVKAAMQAI